ncbi:transposon Tf2-9 polyprotein [Trichonephila clavipes]|uniref:Transposon Tf2-9 polyprotein n=1 Tax=Trichonephila clavipes TaxID=2585209 RepID=A0A8X6WKN6_TRICX|nr:transposon Tf2-9 polyprotein [Trichonephila clavipes]
MVKIGRHLSWHPPLLTTTPHQREDVSALDRFNVHRCPTRRVFSEESQEQLFQHRDNLRREAKQNILKIQEENRRTYNRKWKEAHLYKKGDLVAIMRIQFGNELKLRIKYFGPYQVTKVKPHDRYDVAKIGDHEGPNVTSASADQMKPWTWH